jgi:hypothetical protein
MLDSKPLKIPSHVVTSLPLWYQCVVTVLSRDGLVDVIPDNDTFNTRGENVTMRKEAHEKVVIDIEKAPSVFLAKMSGIVIPEELAQPMKIPLKFILNQFHRGTCEPVVLTDDNVLVDGIRQYKVAKLLKWEKFQQYSKTIKHLYPCPT